MDQGLIPRRYAKALFEVAKERGCDSRIYGLMQTLAESFAAEPALQQTMANPFVKDADKTALVQTASGVSGDKADETFKDFIALLERNRRIDLIRDIAIAFIDLYRRENRIFKVAITSAAPLDEAVRQRMTELIRKQLGDGTLECSFSVDPDLIGGFTVRAGNELLDASVATQLNKIRLGLVK